MGWEPCLSKSHINPNSALNSDKELFYAFSLLTVLQIFEDSCHVSPLRPLFTGEKISRLFFFLFPSFTFLFSYCASHNISISSPFWLPFTILSFLSTPLWKCGTQILTQYYYTWNTNDFNTRLHHWFILRLHLKYQKGSDKKMLIILDKVKQGWSCYSLGQYWCASWTTWPITKITEAEKIVSGRS